MNFPNLVNNSVEFEFSFRNGKPGERIMDVTLHDSAAKEPIVKPVSFHKGELKGMLLRDLIENHVLS